MSRPRSMRVACQLLCFLLLAPMALSACSLPFFTTTISGTIYGEVVTPSAPHVATHGGSAPAGGQSLAASVTCNGAKVKATTSGSFTLQVSNAKSYSCVASHPGYVDIAWQANPRVGSNQINVQLTATSQANTCSANLLSGTVTCPMMHLQLATISGQVRDAQGRPMADQKVRCGRLVVPTDGPGFAEAGQDFILASTTSNSSGHYSVQVRPGAVKCHTANAATLTSVTPAPGESVALNLSGCQRPCGGVAYHDGPVMHTVNAYLIFWLPSGFSFERQGPSDHFESLLKQYFTDVNNSGLYGMMAQYGDYAGPVTPHVTLADAQVDIAPYPKAGTPADPLTDGDLQHEIEATINAHHWPQEATSLFILVTGYGVQTCSGDGAQRECSFGSAQHYCAYHSSTDILPGGKTVPFIYLPVLADCSTDSAQSYYGSPHNDIVADSTMDFLAHEHFEAVTDPFTTGWYGENPSSAEIGDLCATTYGSVNGSSNVSLNGRRYLMQTEWSNAARGCRFS